MTATEPSDPQSDYWRYWQEPALEDRRWLAEADDLVEQLILLISPQKAWKVLDYGCGQGLVAVRLAPLVREIDLWDTSPVARQLSKQACQNQNNATVLEVLPQHAEYDFILVSSVTQYMSETELQQAMIIWRRLLQPGGQALVTDIIPQQRHTLREIADIIWFSLRYHLLFHMLARVAQQLPEYRRREKHRPLVHYPPERFSTMATRAGLSTQQVNNPNLFSSRYAMILT